MIIYEKAYAKVNLALEVMQKINGYHMVNNLMIPIDLYDEIKLEKNNDIIILNNNILDDICYKAAMLFKEKYNTGGAIITVNKRIPISAGLAGGSSNAAAVLKGMNRLYNINATNEELEKLGAILGSDVSFFINNKLALCTNRGEIVNPVDVKYDNTPILLIKPNSGLSTKLVYDNYKYDGVNKGDKIANIIKGLAENNIDLVIDNIFNDLSKVSLKLNNELSNLYNIIKDKNVFISGSGPTIFILNPSIQQINFINNNFNDLFKILTKVL